MAVAACEIKEEKTAESICRLCFTESENYRLIFVDAYSSLHDWIENLTTLKIMKVPNGPASLCLECENTLHNFESFRDMCFTNDRVIKELFSQDNSIDENTATLEDMPVIYEIKTDLSEDQQTDILDSRMECQEENTDITIDYQNIKFEVDSSVDSEDDYDKNDDTEEVLGLEKRELFMETATTDKKRHICNLCDKEFTNANRLTIHIRSHTQERPHKCKDCGKSFITSSSLKRHERSHTGLKPYACDRCPAKYSQSSHLVRHNKRAHLKKNTMGTTKNPDENESSRDTEESENISFLLNPVKGNGKSKKRCTICNKYVFKLKDHLLIHKDTRPYQCKYCPKGYNQIYKLTIHTRTHTNEKPFLCSHCGKGFTNSGDMKIHVRSHTQERPFKCKECKKSFITVSHLVQHRKTHSGIKPYSCDMCEGKFSQNAHLIRHKQAHHKSTTINTAASETNRDEKED